MRAPLVLIYGHLSLFMYLFLCWILKSEQINFYFSTPCQHCANKWYEKIMSWPMCVAVHVFIFLPWQMSPHPASCEDTAAHPQVWRWRPRATRLPWLQFQLETGVWLAVLCWQALERLPLLCPFLGAPCSSSFSAQKVGSSFWPDFSPSQSCSEEPPKHHLQDMKAMIS